jgi:hypothetical protein
LSGFPPHSSQAIDREHLATLRRERGYTANPWSSGSRFIISHSLMADETYVGGLRDLLGNFRPRALFILDEAHHAAPANGSRYAVDSQFTRAVRGGGIAEVAEPAACPARSGRD